MSNNIQDWNLVDPFAGVPLEKIPRVSDRAFSLVARNRSKPLLQMGFFNVVGAVEMLAGLDYHYDNIGRISAALGAELIQDESSLYHEAVAYVNRMGQFYYFAKSELARRALQNPLSLLPTLVKYLTFRMKHSAHRSLDAPHSTDTDELQLSHARSLSRTWGRIMTPKPGRPPLPLIPGPTVGADSVTRIRTRLWQDYWITFQIYDADAGQHLNLTIESEHHDRFFHNNPLPH